MTHDEMVAIQEFLREEFKKDDDKWPINGRFSTVDHAIARIDQAMEDGLVIDDMLSYESMLRYDISIIVNDDSRESWPEEWHFPKDYVPNREVDATPTAITWLCPECHTINGDDDPQFTVATCDECGIKVELKIEL